MKKKEYLLIVAALLCATLLQAQKTEFPYCKKVEFITDITKDSIKLGESAVIYGKKVTAPDIYYKKKKDNTWAVTRLSVFCPKSMERWKPYLETPTANSIVVSWKDLDGIPPYVEYGKSARKLKYKSTGVTELLADETASYPLHKVKLKGLESNTFYYYRVSGDENVYRFKTQPQIGSKQKYYMLFIGDHQMIDRSGYEWLIASAKRTFERNYGSVDKKLNLLMNLGDQVNAADLDLYEQCHFYKSSYIAPSIPVMTTMGNHDIHKDYDMKRYRKIFAYEDIEYQGISTGVDEHYAIQLGSVLVISLNSEYPHTNEQQLAWLRKVVEKADKDESVKFIVSTNHRNAYGETYIKDSCPWMHTSAYPILGLSRKHVMNVNGHQHYYHRGQVAVSDFYHVVTGGSAWAQRWNNSPDQEDNEFIQKTFDYWSYMIVEFDPAKETMKAEAYSIGNPDVAHKELCIDRFSRNLRTTVKPEKPSLKIASGKQGETLFHFSPYRCKNKESFQTRQMQIAKDANFKELVYDRLFNFENFFRDKGAPYFIPVDTQKGLSYQLLALPDTLLPQGKYHCKVRYRNQNLQWSEWSDVSAFAK